MSITLGGSDKPKRGAKSQAAPETSADPSQEKTLIGQFDELTVRVVAADLDSGRKRLVLDHLGAARDWLTRPL